MRYISWALTAALLLLSLAAPSVASTFPGANGDIAFGRFQVERPGIYAVDPDGEGISRLSKKDGDFHPIWSPNGRRIVFLRHLQAGEFTLPHVFVMKADGSRKRHVSGELRGYAQPPVWSPSGRRVAFEDFLELDSGFRGAITTVRRDGTGRKRLTGFGSRNAHPAWSPDGEKIAFISDRDGDPEIFVMNSDGSEETQLTQNDIVDELPEWSSDGSRIVFSTVIPGPPGQGDAGSAIAVMNADGGELTMLTDGSRFDTTPTWSPTEDKVLFAEHFNGGILVVNADGTGEERLSNFGSNPVWSPDGSMVAFDSDGDI
ncbi:MAG: TolB family protein, partial [Actinomycetota bacterium]